MNRENKRRQYEKGYYKTHSCNETFVCKNCGMSVIPDGAGSGHRNHCPSCLTSLHVDEEVGDRESDCGGIMEPIAVWVRGREWVIIHRCKSCGKISSNRIAADDNPVKLYSIALKPLCEPPFPVERIKEIADAIEGAIFK
ncbi:MAG: RNHCP domain-containing protein [Clostridiales bacterium]|nr:RNHCP domain-containing protein [Clostridiales bacterium]